MCIRDRGRSTPFPHAYRKIGQFLEVWVFPATRVGFCHPGAAKTAKKHASLKIWPTARKRQRNHQKLKKNGQKCFFEKSRKFSALDERDCQAASLFAHWGQFGRETRAWPDYPSTFHNGESTKSTLLPSKRVLNRADVADWALVAPRAENGTVSKISNQIIFSQCVVGFCGSCWNV